MQPFCDWQPYFLIETRGPSTLLLIYGRPCLLIAAEFVELASTPQMYSWPTESTLKW
jgi:hypothetical protein